MAVESAAALAAAGELPPAFVAAVPLIGLCLLVESLLHYSEQLCRFHGFV